MLSVPEVGLSPILSFNGKYTKEGCADCRKEGYGEAATMQTLRTALHNRLRV